jgi:hypothetical protein
MPASQETGAVNPTHLCNPGGNEDLIPDDLGQPQIIGNIFLGETFFLVSNLDLAILKFIQFPDHQLHRPDYDHR